MSQQAFSSDGFIINQGLMGDVPYGRKGSDATGCGWIAAYNLEMLYNHQPDALELSKALEKGQWFGGLLGTGPRRLKRFLKKRGHHLKTAFTHKKAARLARHAQAGILLYPHRRGMHYVCFSARDGGKLRFFNAIYGNESHLATMEDFLKQFPISPFVYLMVSTEPP